MPLPRRQRVAAYAVIVRDEQILLSRLAERISRDELWTLPGGGLDHGEDPRDAVVREIHEETGLDAVVGEQARVYSAHMPPVDLASAAAQATRRPLMKRAIMPLPVSTTVPLPSNPGVAGKGFLKP